MTQFFCVGPSTPSRCGAKRLCKTGHTAFGTTAEPEKKGHVNVGDHVTAEFTANDICEVVILQISGNQALVQELGTQRTDWVATADLSR